MHPTNETQIEWMAKVIPDGDKCGGCENIVDGHCKTWGQAVTPESEKCDYCKKTLEGPLWGIKRQNREDER
jgi:hypothetical protein